jgi:uncharacterized protein
METIGATLFGKTRRALLSRLYLEPERSFRLRELSRLTGISAGSVQHELKQLVHADLVARADAGGLVTYRANQRSPVFGDLRAIVEKTSGIDAMIRKALEKARKKIHLALIYGSIAKGANQSRSDIDLLVVGTVEFEALLALLGPLEQRLGREISPRLFSPEEFERKRGGDRFLRSVLSGPTIPLIGERP